MTFPVPAPDRVRVDGKFFRLGAQKFHVKGVTYGPFAPNEDGEMFASREQTRRDLAQLQQLGATVLRVYYVQPLRHAEGMLMAYLPAEHIAFQADLFDTHEPPKAAQVPAMRALATQVERMKLNVETLAPVHGPPLPWSQFEEALQALGDGS